MPIGKYKNFGACVKANKGKRKSKAYCGAIKHKVEGSRGRKKGKSSKR